MTESPQKKLWTDRRIGITGANGALGRSLTKTLRRKGAFVIGFTSKSIQNAEISTTGPNKWIQWECGKESNLKNTLKELDILIINHGINPQGRQSTDDLDRALEINALSSWRIIKLFEQVIFNSKEETSKKELWINTSEAEIQPALSPAYEISKRLIGQLVSVRWSSRTEEQKRKLKIRKLILGPFKSDLNPIGLMSAELVAKQIISQVEIGLFLIIVTPNPLTYIFMPITEFIRTIYGKLILIFNKQS